MGRCDECSPDAGQAGQLTHVAIGDTIRATHWVIVHVAGNLALCHALSLKGHNSVGLPEAGLAGQLANITVSDTIRATDGSVVHVAGHSTSSALTWKQEII